MLKNIRISNDRVVEISFNHYIDARHPGTDCIIRVSHSSNIDGMTVSEDTKFPIVGSTELHTGDRYDRNIGRKLSLHRALLEATNTRNFTREDRKIIWDAYFSTRNGKKL